MNRAKLFWIREYISYQFSKVKKKYLNQDAQTLVEFILLLAVLTGFSLLFMKLLNDSISKYWEFFVNMVIEDPNITLKI